MNILTVTRAGTGATFAIGENTGLAVASATAANTAATRAENARDAAFGAVGVDYPSLAAATAGAANGDYFSYWSGAQIVVATKTAGTVTPLTGPWLGSDKIGHGSGTLQAALDAMKGNTAAGLMALGMTWDLAAESVRLGVGTGSQGFRNVLLGQGAGAGLLKQVGGGVGGLNNAQGIVAIGGMALNSTFSKDFVVSIGMDNMRYATDGYCFTSGGLRGFRFVTTGSYSTGWGCDICIDATSATNVTSLGTKTARGRTTVTTAIVLGVNTGTGQGSLTDAIIIGDNNSDNGGSTATGGNLANRCAVGHNSLRYSSGAHLMYFGNSNASATYMTGGFNGGLGRGLHQSLTSGSLNYGLGDGAGFGVSTANYTLALGCGSNPGNYSETTTLGYNAVGTASKQVVLGGPGTTPIAQAAVQIASDERDKTDITPISMGLDFINAIEWVEFRRNNRSLYREVNRRPVIVEETETIETLVRTGVMGPDGAEIMRSEFTEVVKEVERIIVETEFDEEGHAAATKAGKRRHAGVIAQQVKKLCDEQGIDFTGLQYHAHDGEGEDAYTVGYEAFIPILGRAVQQLAAAHDAREGQMAAMMRRLDHLEKSAGSPTKTGKGK